uniref:Uncharacterized protein n=1 Tax=Plectus sambesii TaxID=2011161 RepID=A0A914URD4_9BILA
MWFEATIVILFLYTVVLILFFMGWCTLIPNMCHPRREIPFSAIKSPRRKSKINTDLEVISIVSRQASLGQIAHIGTGSKASLHSTGLITPNNHYKYSVGSISGAYQDLLHPKYSVGSWQFKMMQVEAQERRQLFCASGASSFGASSLGTSSCDVKDNDCAPTSSSFDDATSASQQSLQPLTARPSIA